MFTVILSKMSGRNLMRMNQDSAKNPSIGLNHTAETFEKLMHFRHREVTATSSLELVNHLLRHYVQRIGMNGEQSEAMMSQRFNQNGASHLKVLRKICLNQLASKRVYVLTSFSALGRSVHPGYFLMKSCTNRVSALRRRASRVFDSGISVSSFLSRERLGEAPIVCRSLSNATSGSLEVSTSAGMPGDRLTMPPIGPDPLPFESSSLSLPANHGIEPPLGAERGGSAESCYLLRLLQ